MPNMVSIKFPGSDTVFEVTDAQARSLLVSLQSDLGTLSSLDTTTKTSLVAAINEIKAQLDEAVSDAGNAVRFDDDQELTDAQKGQARENIGAADDADVSELKSAVKPIVTRLGIDDAYAVYKKVTNNQTPADNANGVRIRIIYILPKGSVVHAVSSYGKGIAVGLYSDFPLAVNSYQGSAIQSIPVSGYTFDSVEMVTSQDGYLAISMCKSDSSVFSDADREAALAALDLTIDIPDNSGSELSALKTTVADNENHTNELYIGPLINGHLTASGVVDDMYTMCRLSSKEIVSFPRDIKAVKVRINKGFLAAIRTGAAAGNLSENLYWYRDGDTIQIPAGMNYYAVSICREYGPTTYISAEIMPRDIPAIGLRLMYDDYEICSDNEAEQLLSSARLRFDSGSGPNYLFQNPVIAHTSDCHGDYARIKSFLDFCDRVGVDLAAITGDMVAHRPYQGLAWFKELVNGAKTLCGVCVGNHDAYDAGMSDQQVYDFVFDGIEAAIGSETGANWYYTDITGKNLRIISVDLYEYGGSTRNYSHFTSTQLDWLCSTLASTPANYGVVLLYHSPQVNLDSARDASYPTFYQSTRKFTNIYSGVSGSPINDIIDAFIGRTTISKTYTQTGSPSSVTVSGNFASVPSSVDFIAHLTGHFHQDTVCYIPGATHLQLMLNVMCTNSLYGGTAYPYLCDLSDLPRNRHDKTQDSFNVYVIDRTAGVVKVIRIGSNITYNMGRRDYMEIPYK